MNDDQKQQSAEQEAKLQLTTALNRDNSYPKDDSKCLLNKKTLEVYWSGFDGGPSVEPTGAHWVLIKGISDSEWHEVFEEWLKEIGEFDAYTNSIGSTLNNLGQDLRAGWQVKQYDYAEKKAEEFLKAIKT